jgi:hypothetical protein
VSQFTSAFVVAASVLAVLMSAYFLFVFNSDALSDGQVVLLVLVMALVFVANLTAVLYVGGCC